MLRGDATPSQASRNLSAIHAQKSPDSGLGATINDRLARAARNCRAPSMSEDQEHEPYEQREQA
jgi:hypothetical protein